MDRDRFDELEEEYEREGGIQPIYDYVREGGGDDDTEKDDSNSGGFPGGLFGLLAV